MPDLPTGTVTFLFTDIEGSTRLWEEQPDGMRVALERHDALLRHAIETRGGLVFKTLGDAFYAAFPTAPEALEAALTAQQALQQTAGVVSGSYSLHVRMALHTGTAEVRQGDYFGQPLNRVARLLSAGHGGQVLLSLPCAELVRDTLPSGVSLLDLGSHRLRDLSRPEQIFQLAHPVLPAEFPPLRTLDSKELPNNLPQQSTSFIGREKELSELKALMGKARLLTLTGSGGAGKTRLMLQLGADLLEEYPDGVWIVELAPLADPALVPQAVASALNVKEEPGKAIRDTLQQSLKSKELLLLLDNCEHLLQACAELADRLISSCPTLKILASSREGLNIPGEQTYRVPSLAVPDPKQSLSAEALSQYEAVKLFIERACFHQPTFSITNQNAPAVAEVCHRLDGIPLALELAAARVRTMSVEQIARRLDDRFRLLTGGRRTAVPRQQTLRALIDWSYNLLSVPERTLLERVSVFTGGCSLEAAEAVCSGVEIRDWEVLDLLTSLVDKSLVACEVQAGAARYHLLETIRQYAREKLADAEDAETVRKQHVDYFIRLAEESESKLNGPEQAEWLERLEQEHDNLRAALEWSREEAPEEGLRLAGALWLFWTVRGYYREGRRWLETVLERREGSSSALAKALHGAGVLAHNQGDYNTARALIEESLEIRRELGDRRKMAYSLLNLGIVAYNQGDSDTARALGEQSLAVSRELENPRAAALSLSNLGNVALDQGDYERACVLYEESLAIARELGDRLGIAYSLKNLGNVARGRGDDKTARARYEQALEIQRELRDKRGIADLLELFGELAASKDEPGRASTLMGAADALREQIGSPRHPVERQRCEHALAEIRASLGEEAFSTAWSRGRAVNLEQAIAFALGSSGEAREER